MNIDLMYQSHVDRTHLYSYASKNLNQELRNTILLLLVL